MHGGCKLIYFNKFMTLNDLQLLNTGAVFKKALFFDVFTKPESFFTHPAMQSIGWLLRAEVLR